jgi:hypothetical protein
MLNALLGGWSIAWMNRQYTLCQVLCIVTVIAQLYTLFFILGSRRSRDFYQRDYLTNLIVKPRIAAAIMLMFKTWGADNVRPSVLTMGVSLTIPPQNLPFPSISIQLCFATLLVVLVSDLMVCGTSLTIGFDDRPWHLGQNLPLDYV